MDDKAFTARLFDLAKQTYEETGYNPQAFRGMLQRYEGRETALRLIHKPEPSEGYTRLWELGRLDLTVEAVVFEESQYHYLFTEEDLNACKMRLNQYEYFSSTRSRHE